MSIHSDLRIEQAMRFMGYTEFKSPEQREMIEAGTAGKDVLSVIPTGGGKTAGAVIPAIVHGHKVIVISPLISLMGDQRDSLLEAGIPAFVIHGKMEQPERIAIRNELRDLASGPAFLFVSPEMACQTSFQKLVRSIDFNLMFVDEVHTVSVWGSTFRQEYQRVGTLWKNFGRPQIVAGSATADPLILRDVKRRIPFGKRPDSPGFVEVQANPIRENLHIQVQRPAADVKSKFAQRDWGIARIKEVLMNDHLPTHGPTIIYCTRTNEVELLCKELADTAESHGYAVGIYHAKLEREHRAHTLRLFRTAKKPLIIATSAFGMGIDRADIRTIIHYGPTDLVEYAQQIGRAGRDGELAYCLTLYLPWMVERGKKAEAADLPDLEQVENVFAQLRRALKAAQDRQQTRLNLNSFHRQYDTWIQQQENVIAPQRHIALRRRAISILAETKYATIMDGYVTALAGMQFGSDGHKMLIELTQMQERRAERTAKRIKSFFTADKPDQHLLFDLIAQE